MKIDLRQFDKHNIWLNEAGEMSVRPGWRSVRNVSGSSNPKGGVSVENPNTGEPAYYVLGNETSGSYRGELNVFLATPGVANAGPDQTINFSSVPNDTQLTYADVDGELVLAAPGMPTLWGYTGGFVGIAEKTQSPAQADAGITALDIPQGLCASWADRCVIASGRTIYISEPFYPRAFGGDNVLAVDGRVYALHVSPNGALIICTNKGVWSFSADAAASGTVVGFLEKVSDFSVNRYNQTCLTKNGLWAISEKGVVRVETAQQQEMVISDKRLTRVLDVRIASTDWRQHATIHATERGFCVSYERPVPGYDALYGQTNATNEGAVLMVDLYTGVKSWWYGGASNTNIPQMNIVSVMKDEFGRDIFLSGRTASNHSYNMVYGNYDDSDEAAPNNNADDIVGTLIGNVSTGTEESPVLRNVVFSSDTDGPIGCAVNGVSAVNSTQNGEAIAPVIGTDTWGSVPYKARNLKSREFDFATRSDDLVVELSAKYSKSRIANDCYLRISGFDKRRP